MTVLYFIMQQGLASNHSADREVYESISSDGEADFMRLPLTLPELPERMPALYGIYIDTAEKIQKLSSKVAELQQKILEMERHKNNSRFDDAEVYTYDDVEEQSQFMIKYEKKCADRELQFKSLAETYSGLKKLSLQANICHNPTLVGLINTFLKKHREVIAYSSSASSILVLSKEVHPAKKRVHMPNAPNRNDSGRKQKRSEKSRSRSRDGNDQLQEKDETFFSLQIVNLNNLVFELDGKMKEIGEDFSLSGLEEIKNMVKKEVSVVRRVKLPSKKSKFIMATCSQEQNYFVLFDSNGKLTVTDDAGSPKASARLGSKEQVVLMQAKGEDLWVGSAEGVLRQYSLLDLKPKRVVACHFQQQHQVSSYLLIGSPKPQKVVFSIHRNLYELDLTTCETRKVGQVAQSIKYTVGNYLISPQQIARLTINKDKYQIHRSEVLNRWYHESSLGKTDQKILLLDETKVIVGTAEGDLRMIKL